MPEDSRIFELIQDLPEGASLETTVQLHEETIAIVRWGCDDYSAEYLNGDCSIRGPLRDIMLRVVEACIGANSGVQPEKDCPDAEGSIWQDTKGES